ncbi:MAG: glycosyltransferase [Bacteroidales bacterium]|nr:glycosyltransferase [Bacteroidales bacterium]
MDNCFDFINQPLWLLVLGGFFAFSFLIYMVYNWCFFARFSFYRADKKKKSSNKFPPVSIVIAAKNEFLNIKENIQFLLNQDYPEFEILIVDDNSQDDTWDLITSFRIDNPHLRAVRLKDSISVSCGKKFPLSIGIKEAQYDYVLLTDADCRPASPLWIKKMISEYDENVQIVLGYGKYYHRKSFLNLFIRFDTARIAMQYFSAAIARFPYMGVGRNLTYKKDLFLKGKGFTNHFNLPSGDDDLFVSEHANSTNTAICIDPDTFMFSKAKRTLKSWWNQKRRHLTSGNKYLFKHKLFLGLYQLNVLAFPVFACILLVSNAFVFWVLLLVLIKYLTQWIIFSGVLKKLEERKLLLTSPLFETIITVFNTIVYISNIINKPKKWK